MKRYQLFLDESGGFIEKRNGKSVKKPSIGQAKFSVEVKSMQ